MNSNHSQTPNGGRGTRARGGYDSPSARGANQPGVPVAHPYPGSPQPPGQQVRYPAKGGLQRQAIAQPQMALVGNGASAGQASATGAPAQPPLFTVPSNFVASFRGFEEQYAPALTQHVAQLAEAHRKAKQEFWTVFGLIFGLIFGFLIVIGVSILAFFIAGVYAFIILIPIYLVSLVVLVLGVAKIVKSFRNKVQGPGELPPRELIDQASWFLAGIRADLRAKVLPTTSIDSRPRFHVLGNWGVAGKGVQVSMAFNLVLADRTKARVTLEQHFKRKVKSRSKRRGTLYITKDVVREVVRVSFRPPVGQSFDPRWQQYIGARPPRVPGMMLAGGGVRGNQASFVYASQRYRDVMRSFGPDGPSKPRTEISTLLLALVGSYRALATAKHK